MIEIHKKNVLITSNLENYFNSLWLHLSYSSPESGPNFNLAPGPFGSLDNLDPPATDSEKVFIPPDIKYWANIGKTNTTILDAGTYSLFTLSILFKLLESIQDKISVNKLTGGLPWYCYTYRQTHCRPLFKMSRKWRTTTKPYVSKNPARSTTKPPGTTTIRPPGCRKFQPIIVQKVSKLTSKMTFF